MLDDPNLWVTFNPGKGDPREVIIDEKEKDVRICNGKDVVKIVWNNGRMIIYRNDLVISTFLGEERRKMEVPFK